MAAATAIYRSFQGVGSPSDFNAAQVVATIPACPAGTTIFLVQTIALSVRYEQTFSAPLDIPVEIGSASFHLIANPTDSGLYVCFETCSFPVAVINSSTVEATVLRGGNKNAIFVSMVVSGQYL